MSAVEYARTDPGVSISEISDIVGIHGAVDEAVQVDPDLRVGVSRLLPVYEDRDVSWFRDFQDWVGATQAEADGDSFPSLAEGLRELSEHVPRCRMRARRLFAIAVAARAFPEIGEPDSELAAL